MANNGDVIERFKTILHRSLTDHIRLAEQALALADEIGQHAWVINREGFGSLFHLLQVMLANELNLAITKLFESPDRRYPDRRSIPVVFRFLEENAEQIPIKDRSRLEAVLMAGRAYDPDTARKLPDPDLTRAAVRQLRSELPKPIAFWLRRDKKVAHTDDVAVPPESTPSWDAARDLIMHAQGVAGILGEAYGIFYFEATDGTYMLSRQAREAAKDLKRLLERAELIDLDRGKRPRLEHGGFVAEAEEQDGLWIARVVDSQENIFAVEASLETAFATIVREIDEHIQRPENAELD